jgi:hypothetical protein
MTAREISIKIDTPISIVNGILYRHPDEFTKCEVDSGAPVWTTKRNDVLFIVDGGNCPDTLQFVLKTKPNADVLAMVPVGLTITRPNYSNVNVSECDSDIDLHITWAAAEMVTKRWYTTIYVVSNSSNLRTLPHLCPSVNLSVWSDEDAMHLFPRHNA